MESSQGSRHIYAPLVVKGLTSSLHYWSLAQLHVCIGNSSPLKVIWQIHILSAI